VESEIERELSNTYQTNAIQMSNNLYQITNAKYQMLNNCKRIEKAHSLFEQKQNKG